MQNDDDQNKAWCMRMAELEGDAEIGAGDPKHPLRCPPMQNEPPAELVDKVRSAVHTYEDDETLRAIIETVLAAVTPQIEARALEEGAKAMQWPDQWPLGTRVRKRKGSSWQGRVVGYYSTHLTPRGYAVESEREPGSVQIYPKAALEVIDPAQIVKDAADA